MSQPRQGHASIEPPIVGAPPRFVERRVSFRRAADRLAHRETTLLARSLDVLAGDTSAEARLGGLLQQMEQAGLGRQARSWVGAGQNEPLSPEAIGAVFGEGGIDAIARQAGLTPKQASDGLSQLLPEVVDRLTPDGQMPDFDQLVRGVDALRARMGG